MTEARATDHRLIAAIVASALFMQNLDSTVVATALPAMARSLGEEPARLSTAITSYLVALTVFIPISGWVADRFGAKRVFMAAIVLFTLASALCAQAQGLGSLIAFRILQGMGGAMMVPVGRLLLLRRVAKSEMISAMTWLTMPALLGPVSGPPIGGFLTDMFGWRSVFLINLPIGVLGLALVAWKIPPTPPEDPGPLDARGMAMVGGALALVMGGLETIGRGVLPRFVPEAALAAGLALGVLAVRHCLHQPRPAVDFGLLAIPTFRSPALPGSIFRAGAGSTPFLIPMMLQLAFGASATQSGLISFATSLGAFTMKPLVRPVLRRFGFRRVLVANGVIAVLLVGAIGLVSPAWPWAAIFALLALGGLARSLQFTSLNTLAFADVAPARMAAATSLYGTTQQLSPALGVVIAGAALEISSGLAGRHALALPDFSAAFAVAALTMAAALPWHARLPRDAGAAVSGHDGR